MASSNLRHHSFCYGLLMTVTLVWAVRNCVRVACSIFEHHSCNHSVLHSYGTVRSILHMLACWNWVLDAVVLDGMFVCLKLGSYRAEAIGSLQHWTCAT